MGIGTYGKQFCFFGTLRNTRSQSVNWGSVLGRCTPLSRRVLGAGSACVGYLISIGPSSHNKTRIAGKEDIATKLCAPLGAETPTKAPTT